jgi:hypothetical protein
VQIALLTQEGSRIAKRIPRGVVPKAAHLQMVSLEPPRRFAPPLLTQEGIFPVTPKRTIRYSTVPLAVVNPFLA